MSNIDRLREKDPFSLSPSESRVLMGSFPKETKSERRKRLSNMDLKRDYSLYKGDILKDGKPIGYIEFVDNAVVIKNHSSTKQVPKYILKDLVSKFKKQNVSMIFLGERSIWQRGWKKDRIEEMM